MSGNSDEQEPGGDRAKLDATGEFFSVGTPLHAVRAGYVHSFVWGAWLVIEEAAQPET